MPQEDVQADAGRTGHLTIGPLPVDLIDTLRREAGRNGAPSAEQWLTEVLANMARLYQETQ